MKLFSQQLANKTPLKSRPESPIIIIGMHRSGTTLTTLLLEDLGVSMGCEQQISTSEDLFFQRLNELLLALSNATWDNPKSFSSILKNQDWNLALTKVISHELSKSKSIRFSTNPCRQNKRKLWGFKDPRNTYTLPIWLNIFPNAKVINILRNGESVASSLLNRGNNNLKEGKSLSLVSLSTSLSLDLWAEYVMEAHKNCSALSDEQYFELKYETLLESPETTIRQILNFLEIDANQEEVNKAVSRVKYPNNHPVVKVKDISATAQAALTFYGYDD
ncbi:sulfotransferase [uncultured Cocleimonas sp.]|uniref:sulfotransferase n=1 Tax=uncultured Cocleimonas sp. TaxID=1051587 RepID=UPI0026073514|nr:sulfotransferase [uncultured Cocleimonas sp.]